MSEREEFEKLHSYWNRPPETGRLKDGRPLLKEDMTPEKWREYERYCELADKFLKDEAEPRP